MKKIFILIILSLISFHVSASEVIYRFHWSLIPVSQLIIQFHQQDNDDNKNEIYLRFSLKTIGPLKLYRKYQANGFLDFKNKNEWTYNLSGNDRGDPESKIISYSKNSFPQIIEFIDDNGEKPISIDTEKDIGSIDPFSVILNLINKLKLNGKCDTTMRVYDGKRRYLIDARSDESIVTGKTKNINLIECKLNLIGSFEDDKNKKNKWPFNGEKRSLTIFFDNSAPFLPVMFKLRTPIGIISGVKENFDENIM